MGAVCAAAEPGVMAGATAAIRIIENAMLKGRGSRTKGNSFIVWGSNYLWPEGLRLACIQRSERRARAGRGISIDAHCRESAA